MSDFINKTKTNTMDIEAFRIAFNEFLQLCLKHKITNFNVLFGFAWGNEYKNWQSYETSPQELKNEIEALEVKKIGKLGNDELSISINKSKCEILFCHERDIHFSYNEENHISIAILSWLKTKK